MDDLFNRKLDNIAGPYSDIHHNDILKCTLYSSSFKAVSQKHFQLLPSSVWLMLWAYEPHLEDILIQVYKLGFSLFK